MNLVLFESHELAAPLPRADRRARHVVEVLRRQVGEDFDVGLVDGPRGKATLTALDEHALTFSFRWGPAPPPLDALTVLVGLPRPQTARDLLRELTTLGVSQLHFLATDKTEPSYASSTLWSGGEWRRHLIAGAEQAFDTRLPEVTWNRNFSAALAALPANGARLVLDNYEAPVTLGEVVLPDPSPVVLALGPERGWSAPERDKFREHHFTFVHLGPRVLRVETAAIAAISIIRSRRGVM